MVLLTQIGLPVLSVTDYTTFDWVGGHVIVRRHGDVLRAADHARDRGLAAACRTGC